MNMRDQRVKTPVDSSARIVKVPVWDLVVRLGHWSLVVCVAYALFARPQFPGHDIAGYVILAIVLWRWVWGFIGTRYARFSAFIFSPRETLQCTLSAFRMGEAREYTSHNPMGALMVFAILLFLPAVCILGLMLFATQQLSGPFVGMVPVVWDEQLEVIHEFAAWAFSGLIAFHLVGTASATWWHRENYVLAMITGMKSRQHRRGRRTSVEDRARVNG